MSDSHDSAPAGPDFSTGVPSHTIAEGTMLLGHIGSDGIVVARRDGHCYAVGATCTHWSGPLADGILAGDTIRCPWHHACFNLKTGEAVSGPALDPIPCYRVEERDGTVFVQEQLHIIPSATPIASPRTIVIIGGGAAGVGAAEMLRRQGYDGSLHIIDDRPTLPVDRPNLSKDYLSGVAQEEWVYLRPQAWYEERRIVLVLDTQVTRIDTSKKIVETENGTQFPFDCLLIATGATPIALDTPGAQSPGVHYLRTLADSKAIIASATNGARAVVIGASFIGLEVAASLRARGIDVHVVAPESRPLERIVGAQLGDMVRAYHEDHGVVFHLGQTATSFDLPTVHLSDGQTLHADFVVIGVGVRPALQLAEEAGLHIEKGVLVNEYLETSIPGIYAAGDIARWPDPHSGQSIRVEHWVVATQQGQTAARNMLGAREPFTAVPFFWSAHYDMSIDYVGHAEHWTQLEIDGDPMRHDCAVRYHDGNRVAAIATVGRERESLMAEATFD